MRYGNYLGGESGIIYPRLNLVPISILPRQSAVLRKQTYDAHYRLSIHWDKIGVEPPTLFKLLQECRNFNRRRLLQNRQRPDQEVSDF